MTTKKTGTSEETQARTPGEPIQDAVRCGAYSRSTGEPCKNPPMLGSFRCRMHGAATKSSRAKAQERILAAADPAAARLVSIMQDKKVPYNVQLAAAKDLLDRAGIGNRQEVTVELKAWERDIEDLFVHVDIAPPATAERDA